MAQKSAATNFTVTTTSTQVLGDRSAGGVRTMIYIINKSPAVLTVVMGDISATDGQGIRLAQNQAFVQSTDGGGMCWQTEVQAVSAGSSDITVIEQYDDASA